MGTTLKGWVIDLLLAVALGVAVGVPAMLFWSPDSQVGALVGLIVLVLRRTMRATRGRPDARAPGPPGR